MQQTIDKTQITAHMPVVCSNGDEIGMVDHLDANNTIKLTKDQGGQHHWIPMAWVSRVDNQVHLDRPGDQVTRDWSIVDPKAG
jgi:hypothetical protein